MRRSEAPEPPIDLNEVEQIEDEFVFDDDVSGEYDTRKAKENFDVVEHWEPGALQVPDVVPAFEIEGFRDLIVTATLEKKAERKTKNPNDPQFKNQDNVIIDHELDFFAIADELGSAERVGGSARLEESLPKILRACLAELESTPKEIIIDELVQRQQNKFTGSKSYLRGLFEDMKRMVNFDLALAKKSLALLRAISRVNADIQETKSQTTFCGGFIHTRPDGTRWAILANIGDSGACKQRADGEMIQLFHEDALLEVVMRSRAIPLETLREYARTPTVKFELPINKAIAMAMGSSAKDAEILEASERVLPMTFNQLKSTMVAAVGGSRAVAALAIRRFNPGESLLLTTDGCLDMFPKTEGEGTDMVALGKAFQGKNDIERLNNLREDASWNGFTGVASNKQGDDFAALSLRFK